jgi:F420H(2)-dependent quinone reductase
MDVSQWMEQRVGIPLLNLHDRIYQGTNGRIGHRVPGAPPSLLLHTIGAKTGQQRTTSLTYARDGENYLIVASNGGDPKPPGWYFNVKAQPDIEINVGPHRFPVTAKPVLPDDPDYARLWEIVNKNNANRYKNYQTRTARPIPVIVLRPRSQRYQSRLTGRNAEIQTTWTRNDSRDP